MAKENENDAIEVISDEAFDKLFEDDAPHEPRKVEKTILTKEKEAIDLVDETKDDADDQDDQDNKPDGDSVLDSLDSNDDDDDDDEEDDTTEFGSRLVSSVQKLIEKNILQVFIDEQGKPIKDLNQYTEEELIELVTENIQSAIDNASVNAPLEMFKQFPESVQKIVHYTLNGGTEDQLKAMFSQLAVMREISELDPEVEADGISIIQRHLEEENVLSAEDIADEINRIKDSNKVSDYAKKYKEILDAKQEKILQRKLTDQENLKKQKQDAENKMLKGFVSVLSAEAISGVELERSVREQMFNELKTKHQTENGSVNGFEYLAQRKMNGSPEEVEAAMLAFAVLRDPKGFIQSMENKMHSKLHAQILAEVKEGKTGNSGGGVNIPAGKKGNSKNRRLAPAPSGGGFFSR